MLHKWRIILTNWINCYFNESTKKEETVTLESLITIISHLREYLNLDESKSSVLEAHTIEEFLSEKYPQFKFENGTIEPYNVEDLYIAASLLLFFVCVNSKDVDMKHAMCSKLSSGDQETILKFSKCLMECPVISYGEVLAAITEACGQDIASSHTEVTETPPALRSLHGEVRRLQAALDAERFDRNYLQDELARTNLKLEKLLKDKDHYKEEIMELKAKISLCCGQEVESRDSQGDMESTSKLLRQLNEMEERLVQTQGELEEVHHEREVYKKKVDELKQERDKWLALGQQESSRANQLADELDVEKRNVTTLRELVSELRQHNRLTRMDSSLLECDDPDASVPSFQHNLSICSDACSNIVEVQLLEEKAKVTSLQTQIQNLQEQLTELNEKTMSEMRSLEVTVSEKDTDILNLKHRINEEIEEKSNMKSYYDRETIKLHNEINELEQTLKSNIENSRKIIEKQIEEIKTLQEEKISLLQSLSDETTKLESVIKKLKEDIDSEKNARNNMKEEYENHIMKLNEKVLNRNNELVELQNNISERSEMIEKLNYDLRKEKEAKDELSNKYHNDVGQLNQTIADLENNLQFKTLKVEELEEKLTETLTLNETVNKEFEFLKITLTQLQEKNNDLEDSKFTLVTDIKNRDIALEAAYKELENLKDTFAKETEKWQHTLDERNETVNNLHLQLQSEIQYKVQLQNEFTVLQSTKDLLMEEIDKVKTEMTKFYTELQEKERTVDALDLYLKEEKQQHINLKETCKTLNDKIHTMSEEIKDKNAEIKGLHEKYESETKYYQNEIQRINGVIDSTNIKLHSEIAQKNVMKNELSAMKEEKNSMDKNANEMTLQITQLTDLINENKITICNLEQQLTESAEKYSKLEKTHESETSKISNRVQENEKKVKELKSKLKMSMKEKLGEINTLKTENDKLQKTVEIEKEKINKLETEKVSLKNDMEKLNKYLSAKNSEVGVLKDELTCLSVEIQKKTRDCNTLQDSILKEQSAANELKKNHENEIKDMQKKLESLVSKNQDLNNKLKLEMDDKIKTIQEIQQQNEQLQLTIEKENENNKAIAKEKDQQIQALDDQLVTKTDIIDSLQKTYETLKFELETKVAKLQELVDSKSKQIDDQQKYIRDLENCLEQNAMDKEKNNAEEKALRDALETEKTKLIDEYKDLENDKAVLTLELMEERTAKGVLTLELMEERTAKGVLINQKENLMSEKETLMEILSEENIIKQTLLEEKECLAQQLIEEKSAKQIVEQEKAILNIVKEQLEQKIAEKCRDMSEIAEEKECIAQQLVDERNSNNIFKEENNNFKQELAEVRQLKEHLAKEIEDLSVENATLKDSLDQLKSDYDVLENNVKVLSEENKKLNNILNELKAAHNEIEAIKDSLTQKLNDSNEQYIVNLKNNQDELKAMAEEVKHLQLESKQNAETNKQISSTIDSGLQKLIGNIRTDEIRNERLQKLISEYNATTEFDKCDLIVNIADALMAELALKMDLEKALENESSAVSDMKTMCAQKQNEIQELQAEVKALQKSNVEANHDYRNYQDKYNTIIDTQSRDIQKLQQENDSLNNQLNDVKVQLETKVHSLKDKLVDNENLTDKLKTSYECQIESLNVMVNKLTSYLKDKTVELEQLRKDKETLLVVIEENKNAIKLIEEEVSTQKQNQEKLISDFESERLVLKNVVSVTESVMNDQKESFNNIINEHLKTIDKLQNDNKTIKDVIEAENRNVEVKLQEKETALVNMLKELNEERTIKENILREVDVRTVEMEKEIGVLKEELKSKEAEFEAQKKEMADTVTKYKQDLVVLEESNDELKIIKDRQEVENSKLSKELNEKIENIAKLVTQINELEAKNVEMENQIKIVNEKVEELEKNKTELETEKSEIERQKDEYVKELEDIKIKLVSSDVKNDELDKLKKENVHMVSIIEENKSVITNLEQLIKHELEQNQQLREETGNEKLNLTNKCSILEVHQTNAEAEIEAKNNEIDVLQKEIKHLLTLSEKQLLEKDDMLSKVIQEKDALISTMSKELVEEKTVREKCQAELESKTALVYELKQKYEVMRSDLDVMQALKKENDELVKALGQRETFAAVTQEKLSHKYSGQTDKDHMQVDNTSIDNTHTSNESYKTISDLETIIHDKNRTITTLQSDIAYMKSLMADSENRLLDVTKELEMSRDNCEQLSAQLKKLVAQKNDEITDLKKQVNKMSVTENRASQIIKVSAKYQAMILKRIAEIKSNTVLKELTNFGNSNSTDSELRRSLTVGSVTMEDLENFLETTDRHLRKCSEKQVLLQKERDRLTEVNRINESEIINLKKFLTELSVSFKTFSSVKELYAQKLSRVVSLQRTVRREVLSMEGQVNDATMCKLERGYAAVLQDLAECAMNIERWVERCIGRTISAEKIKQAFTSDMERASLASNSFQNTSLEVQLDELEKSFQKLLEEVVRAQKGDTVKNIQAATVMEVRAEYEDKLNRMKAKMKQLYQEQISVYKERQKEEIGSLERELQKARDKLSESSRAYEEHIKSLTTELWSVGEKFLMKKDEAEWLRKKQKSGSLMSLQHVHSSGLLPPQEERFPPRPSDTHSLRSLPVNNNANKKDNRTLHMEDEEGEVFDNRYLKELTSTPDARRDPQRLSELRWRNSLCPPHLKSSYPAETQFSNIVHEEDIKLTGAASLGGRQRKEVGITAYKKPGPPTPSKQAGRLSATDSELRESIRVEPEPRKAGTPSRLAALFRSHRQDADGTPRSRRLSNIFRRK